MGKVGAGRGVKVTARRRGTVRKTSKKKAVGAGKKKKQSKPVAHKPKRQKPVPRKPKAKPKRKRQGSIAGVRKPSISKSPGEKKRKPAPEPKKRKRKPATGGRPDKGRGGRGSGGGKPPAGPSRPLPEGAENAEGLAQDYLVLVQQILQQGDPALGLSIKSFVNRDGTMDAELRIVNIPDFWKDLDGIPAMAAFLSEVFQRTGELANTDDGGRFWVSIGVRFGPSNESELGELAEIYKRHRGMLQVASYPLATAIPSGFQNAIVAIESITKSLMTKRGIPISSLFIRITWMPKGMHPSRFKGERGGGD